MRHSTWEENDGEGRFDEEYNPSPIDEQLRELGYDPEKLELRAVALIRTLKENIELKAALKKEEQDHYYTRCTWEETTKDRDNLRIQVQTLKEKVAYMNSVIHPNE